LPGWLAVIIQTPTPTGMALVVVALQTEGVLEVYVTGRCELAVADRRRGTPKVVPPVFGKLIVWLTGTGSVTVTGTLDEGEPNHARPSVSISHWKL